LGPLSTEVAKPVDVVAGDFPVDIRHFRVGQHYVELQPTLSARDPLSVDVEWL